MFLKSLIIGALSGFFAMLPFLIVFHLFALYKKHDIKKEVPHLAAAYVFAFFISAILSTTGVPSVLYVRIDANINLIPFTDIFSNFIQYVENILLFMPVGFLLPVLWTKFERLSLTVIAGALFSLFIEVSQLFCYRATDIDDLIMNTLGALLGFYIYIAIKALFPGIKTIFKGNQIIFSKFETEIYFVIAWLAMFLIQPFTSDWLWSFILR